MISGIRSPPDLMPRSFAWPRFGRANGERMNGPLTGRLIFIVEDEPLIALSMTLAFEDEAAWVAGALHAQRSPNWG